MNKILVLTANTGRYDSLSCPDFASENIDYIAVSDQPQEVPECYKAVKNINFSSIDKFGDRRNAKLYKALSTILFPDYEYILWHDGSQRLLRNPEEYIKNKEIEGYDITMEKHSQTDRTVYEELINVRNRDLLRNLTEQSIFYIREGLPIDTKLISGTNYIIKNTEASRRFQLMWWEQICKFSSRDQCSLPYCFYKLGPDINARIMDPHAFWDRNRNYGLFSRTYTHEKKKRFMKWGARNDKAAYYGCGHCSTKGINA